MKTIMFCAAFLATAGYVPGEAPHAHVTYIEYAPSTKISASDITYSAAEHTTYARGSVRLTYGSSTILADEADLHITDRRAVDLDVDLRGHVRVRLTPSTMGR